MLLDLAILVPVLLPRVVLRHQACLTIALGIACHLACHAAWQYLQVHVTITL
jgi:hypothetical protein